jgi:hypothetical protein
MRRSLFVLFGLVAGIVGCASETPGRGPDPAPMPTTLPTTPGMPNNPPVQPTMCQGQPAPRSPLALLTRREYDNTLLDLLGDATRPASAFPPENQVQGFNNFTGVHQASPLLVESYLEAAESAAQRAVNTQLGYLAPCATGADPLACGRDFVRGLGLRAFRRPLDPAEAALFDDLFSRTYARVGYTSAVQVTIGAMLQSPQFLYRVDTLRAPTPESGAVPIGPYQLATKLSYFLTGSMPDAPLFAAAQANQLSTDQEIANQARRLLATPRAKETVHTFHQQWLGLDSLPSVSRDIPELGLAAQDLGGEWTASLNRFLDYAYWEVGNVSALFDSKVVFFTPKLLPVYGQTASAEPFTALTFPDRAGLLTQPALMALLAHSDQSAPVLRGVFVRERLMCIPVPPPPPSVNVTPPDPDPSATTRERFRVHTESDECKGCHAMIDGIGFGFEAYDQFGRYRTVENGLPIDVKGEVLGTGDPSLDGAFEGAPALSARLAQSRRVRDCVATNWYRFAFGRMETSADACSLDDVKARFDKSGGKLDELLISITQSVAFRFHPATQVSQ